MGEVVESGIAALMGHAGTLQAVFAVGIVWWRKPETLRPSNIAAAVTAPGRAAVGWVQETLIPPGPPLAVEEASSLVLRWQATKASALGERPLAHESVRSYWVQPKLLCIAQPGITIMASACCARCWS